MTASNETRGRAQALLVGLSCACAVGSTALAFVLDICPLNPWRMGLVWYALRRETHHVKQGTDCMSRARSSLTSNYFVLLSPI